MRFTYDTSIHDPGREAREAVVRPYLEPSLATHALYLIGWDETRDAVRTFKVDRIRDLSLTTQTFEPPEGTIDQAMRNAWDIISDQPETEVVLRFDPSVAARVRETTWHPSEQAVLDADGSLRWRAVVAGTDRDPRVDPVVGATRSRSSSRQTCAPSWPRSTGSRWLAMAAPMERRPSKPLRRRDPVTHSEIPSGFRLVNLISDPIHGYVELTKRATAAEARAAGLPPEDAAEEDLLDTAWMQRLRRVSQLQSARWVFPTAEHSRFTHGLGVMHEAGLWARALYPTLRSSLRASGEGVPSEGLVVETLRVAGLLHDVGHGPFAHFFDEHVLAAFPAPADERRPGGKPLTHEDLSALIIERELGSLIGALRRAPGSAPERDGFAAGESIDARWVSFLISKPAIVDPAMPAWVRRLQPLLSGVFTVDNLDYVRRDAYLTGVAVGPVDVERLRRYAFVGPEGLSLYEPGVGALEMFLTVRFFMYRQVYFHRTVRAIDLDLAEVFADSVRAIVRRCLPGRRPRDVRRPRRIRAAAPGGALGPWRIAVGDARAGRRDGATGRGRWLAGDPAAPAALARRARGPRRVRDGRVAGHDGRGARRRRCRTCRRGPDRHRRASRSLEAPDARDRAPGRGARAGARRGPRPAAGVAAHRTAVPPDRLIERPGALRKRRLVALPASLRQGALTIQSKVTYIGRLSRGSRRS